MGSLVAPSLRCPSCSGPLRPAVLACDACNLKIEAQFASNEFASLGGDDLHFLRIFVHTEGRIREMEAALGISYPTVKARIAELKERLHTHQAMMLREAEADTGKRAATPAPSDDTASVLRDLENGTLSFDEAMKRIRGTP